MSPRRRRRGSPCRFDGEIQPVAFSLWLEMGVAARGPELLRTKGIVNLAGARGPVVVHGVQHVLHPPVTLDRRPSDDRSTRVVFIGRDPLKDVLRRSSSARGRPPPAPWAAWRFPRPRLAAHDSFAAN